MIRVGLLSGCGLDFRQLLTNLYSIAIGRMCSSFWTVCRCWGWWAQDIVRCHDIPRCTLCISSMEGHRLLLDSFQHSRMMLGPQILFSSDSLTSTRIAQPYSSETHIPIVELVKCIFLQLSRASNSNCSLLARFTDFVGQLRIEGVEHFLRLYHNTLEKNVDTSCR